MIVLGHHLSVVWLVLLALATFRLTRFVTADDYPLWVPLRRKITTKWPPNPGAWSEIVVCPWCASPYLGAGLFVWWLYWPAGLAPVAVILACSAVAGTLAEWSG